MKLVTNGKPLRIEADPCIPPDKPGPNQHDDRLRLYVALLLISAYIMLLLLMPWIPAAHDPLVFLGPSVGAIVGYTFGNQRQRES